MSASWLLTMRDESPAVLAGGKAAGLFRLLALGLDVPRFVVLTTEAYRAACPAGRVPAALPAGIEALLDQAWSELGAGAVPLAVRSSAAEEDGSERSYAGQMESFLNVIDRPSLSAAVLGCWRSLHGERAAAYRSAAPGRVAAAAGAAPAMAVVIQEMVFPSAAGVLFTVNPAAGRIDEMLVSSVWGLGEGLVSGALDADLFVLDRQGRVRSVQLADKSERVAAATAGGTRRVPVDIAEAGIASLDETLLAELARQGLAAERLAGRPLDIEFAVAGGRLHFLQARPVTGFAWRQGPQDGHRQVWDNSNIVESYPGITLPLTFSFVRRAYHAVYWQFSQLLGLTEAEIRRHDHMLANMLGLIRGRVYYNLHNWYRLVALLPGFRFNKGFMEAMMGVRQPEDLADTPPGWRQKYLHELPRLVRAGLRAVRLHLSLPGMIRRFHRDFDRAYRHFAAIDYESLSPAQVMCHYREMEEAVLWQWKAPIVNDFSAMIFYGVLKRLTVAWAVDPEGSLQNALLSGQGRIESTEVASQLDELGRRIAADGALREAFLALPPAAALALIEERPELQEAFRHYLERYGDRCIEELKLESIPLREDPTFCVAMLQNYLRRSAPAPAAEPDARLCAEAEAELARRLRGKFTRCGLPRLAVYRWVLGHARAAVRNRENQRLARTRAYALVRRMFRSVGGSFCRAGLLDEPRDIFYLELAEIAGFIDGTSTLPELRELVRLRRQSYDRFRAAAPLADHFETFGPAGSGQAFAEEGEAVAEEGVLQGLGACPGTIERPAVVLLEPDATVRLDGEILVTRQTDPGWVLLFPAIGGLVVERGSMLSHSAIVAREMGIPAVVGVAGASRRIRTGDRLRLDGARGTVEILGAGAEEAR